MKTSELRQLGVGELKKELLAMLREQFNLRMQHATRQLAQTSKLKEVRCNIARARTILSEKADKTA